MPDNAMVVRCVCGWEASGTEDEIVAAATEHGERVHNMRPSREEILAMVVPNEPIEETVRYADGTTKYTGFLLDGAMHGGWSWYRTDGSLMRTGTFERGRRVGTWRTYDRTGAVVKETAFGD
jgi:predicted small metal-binding protein